MNRSKIIEKIKSAEIADIFVIGGGASGLGVALDAVSRSLKVVLAEKHDFGKGTTSKATKLLHGGVRYLAQGDIGLVMEALKERRIILSNALHLSNIQEFIIPFYNIWQGYFYLIGLKLYDILSFKSSLGSSRLLKKDTVLKKLPNVKSEGLKGGISYYDGQFDDTRLCIDLVSTINAKGGSCINYTSFEGFNKNDKGVFEIQLTDHINGENYTILSRSIVNAAGVHADEIVKKCGLEAHFSILPAKGSHLVVSKQMLSSDAAVMIPKTSDGRVLFVVPWHGVNIIGTTDIAVQNKEYDPDVSDEEVEFMLSNCRNYFNDPPEKENILSKYSGLRPLVTEHKGKDKSKDVSRKHKIVRSAAGFYNLLGGKWTTFRKMGYDAVDFLIKDMGWPSRSSFSHKFKISGPSPESSEDFIHPDLPYNKNFFIHSIKNELVESIEDLLARRTRCLFINKKATLNILDEMIDVMAEIKSKDQTWKLNQKHLFLHLANKY